MKRIERRGWASSVHRAATYDACFDEHFVATDEHEPIRVWRWRTFLFVLSKEVTG